MSNKMERRAFFALLRLICFGESREQMSSTIVRKGRKGNLKVKNPKTGRAVRILLGLLGFVTLSFWTGVIGVELGAHGATVVDLLQITFVPILLLHLLLYWFTSITYLYYVKEIPVYLSLPYRPTQILAAKLIHFIGLSALGKLMLLPLLVTGMRSGPYHYSAGAYIMAFLLFVLASLAVDFFFTSLSILLMRFSRFARNKDRFTTFFSILVMVVAIGFGVAVQFVGNRPENIASGLTQFGQSQALYLLVGIVSPPTFFTSAIFTGGVHSLLGIVAACLCFLAYLALLYFVGKRYYFEGVLALQGAGGDRVHKRFSQESLHQVLAGRSELKALMQYDWLKLRRTPTFFTQLILSPLLLPIYFIAIVFVVSFLNRPAGQSLHQIFGQVQTFAARLDMGSRPLAYVLLGLSVWMALNGASLHGIKLVVSTDGEDFFFLKQLPISMKSYLLAKFCVIFPISLIPLLLMTLLLLIVAKVPLYLSLYLLAYAITGMLAMGFLLLYVGACFPNFRWTNETQLVKGFSNVLWVYLEILLCALIAAVPVLLVFFILPSASGYALGLAWNCLLALGCYFLCMVGGSNNLRHQE